MDARRRDKHSGREHLTHEEHNSLSNKEEKRYPRWIVTLGLVIYCVLCWALVFELGASAFRHLIPHQVEIADSPSGASPDGAARR